jgi:hypothetical protein
MRNALELDLLIHASPGYPYLLYLRAPDCRRRMRLPMRGKTTSRLRNDSKLAKHALGENIRAERRGGRP